MCTSSKPKPAAYRPHIISSRLQRPHCSVLLRTSQHATYIISYHTPAQASGYPTRVHKLAVLQTEKVAGFVKRLYASRIHDLESLRRVAVECGAGHVPHRPTPRSMLHCGTAGHSRTSQMLDAPQADKFGIGRRNCSEIASCKSPDPELQACMWASCQRGGTAATSSADHLSGRKGEQGLHPRRRARASG